MVSIARGQQLRIKERWHLDLADAGFRQTDGAGPQPMVAVVLREVPEH